jgi:hypothetical protein
MIIKDERYVITTRRTPIRYSADDRNEFYRTGDLSEVIEDAYKWIDEEDADEYLKKNMNTEDFDVRKVNITYEVV